MRQADIRHLSKWATQYEFIWTQASTKAWLRSQLFGTETGSRTMGLHGIMPAIVFLSLWPTVWDIISYLQALSVLNGMGTTLGVLE